jgi:hypothetical protein
MTEQRGGLFRNAAGNPYNAAAAAAEAQQHPAPPQPLPPAQQEPVHAFEAAGMIRGLLEEAVTREDIPLPPGWVSDSVTCAEALGGRGAAFGLGGREFAFVVWAVDHG